MLEKAQARLTIMHVYQDKAEREHVERAIATFFPEADRQRGCQRFAVRGRLEDVVERYWATAKIDLIMAPSVKFFRWVNPFRTSTRARLLERIPAPLWTMTAGLANASACGSIRRIGCYVNFVSPNVSHLQAAVRMARQLGAQVHVLCVTPSIEEDALLTTMDSDAPLHSDVAEARLLKLVQRCCPDAAIHVETGKEETKLAELARRTRCDVVFLGEGHGLSKGLTGQPQLNRLLGRLPCPAICLDGASRYGSRWVIEPRDCDNWSAMRSLLALRA
ncbi:MAG: universal stress protein [Bryobacterales bacterium]